MAGSQDVGSLHYESACVSAWHADVAAKQAASLAKWVDVLYSEVNALQSKVNELEDWKKNTLELMNVLRKEHRNVRKKVQPPDEGGGDFPGRSKSLPISLADHVEPGDQGLHSKNPKKVKATPSLRPPPGLAEPTERPPPGLELEVEGGKQRAVRFGAAEAKSPAAGNDEQGTLSISQIPASAMSPTSNLGASTTRSTTSVADFAVDDLAREGVQVRVGETDGSPCEVAEWRISRLSEKLKGCMGKNLVSPAFEAAGLKDLRLMVVPDGKDVARGQKGTKRQKEAYAKKVSEGPLEGCLKLKIPDCPEPGVVEYSLKVGDVTKGPFRHNFVDTSVNGCDDFGIDWLRQVEPDHSLSVAVLIFRGPGHENAPREADAD
jgi:hypothetical protein